jgi:hypothetical protein
VIDTSKLLPRGLLLFWLTWAETAEVSEPVGQDVLNLRELIRVTRDMLQPSFVEPGPPHVVDPFADLIPKRPGIVVTALVEPPQPAACGKYCPLPAPCDVCPIGECDRIDLPNRRPPSGDDLLPVFDMDGTRCGWVRRDTIETIEEKLGPPADARRRDDPFDMTPWTDILPRRPGETFSVYSDRYREYLDGLESKPVDPNAIVTSEPHNLKPGQTIIGVIDDRPTYKVANVLWLRPTLTVAKHGAKVEPKFDPPTDEKTAMEQFFWPRTKPAAESAESTER